MSDSVRQMVTELHQLGGQVIDLERQVIDVVHERDQLAQRIQHAREILVRHAEQCVGCRDQAFKHSYACDAFRVLGGES